MKSEAEDAVTLWDQTATLVTSTARSKASEVRRHRETTLGQRLELSTILEKARRVLGLGGVLSVADEDFGDGDGCLRAPPPGPDATPALGARVEALELRLFLRVVERGDE